MTASQDAILTRIIQFTRSKLASGSGSTALSSDTRFDDIPFATKTGLLALENELKGAYGVTFSPDLAATGTIGGAAAYIYENQE